MPSDFNKAPLTSYIKKTSRATVEQNSPGTSQIFHADFSARTLKHPKTVESTKDAKIGDMEHTVRMTDPITRPELDAKLEAVEARLDARIARIEAAVDGFKGEASQLRTELSHAKWWAIGTAIAVLSIFLGVAQWGLSMQKEENARFSGYIREDVKSIGDDVKEMNKGLNEMRLLLERHKPPVQSQ